MRTPQLGCGFHATAVASIMDQVAGLGSHRGGTGIMRFTTPRIGSSLDRIVTALGLVAGVLILAAPASQATNLAAVSAAPVTPRVRTAADPRLRLGYDPAGL